MHVQLDIAIMLMEQLTLTMLLFVIAFFVLLFFFFWFLVLSFIRLGLGLGLGLRVDRVLASFLGGCSSGAVGVMLLRYTTPSPRPTARYRASPSARTCRTERGARQFVGAFVGRRGVGRRVDA